MVTKTYTIPEWQGGDEQRTPGAGVINATARPIHEQTRQAAAANRRYGAVFGETWLAGNPDILRERDGYLYLRAVLALGELDAIVTVEIAGDTYVQESPESSANYRGDWSSSETWTDDYALPWTAKAGEIYKFDGLYYVVKRPFAVAETSGVHTPAGINYRAYFGRVYAGTHINSYRGTLGQGVDPLMLELFSGDYSAYNDTLTGDWYGTPWALAYVTAKLPLSQFTQGWPAFRALVRGWRCYDPRIGTALFTRNPALQLATFIASPLVGLDTPVNPVSVIAAADRCDARFPEGPRIECNIEVGGTPVSTPNWIETLRAYAGVMIDFDNDEYHFIVDGPRDTDWRIAFGDPQSDVEMIALPDLQLIDLFERKNVVRVKYTDTTTLPWKEAVAVADSGAVSMQREAPVVQEYRMPGILSRAQAERCAMERLEEYQAETFLATLAVADEGAAVKVGHIAEITSPNGLQRVRVRVLGKRLIDVGTWQLRVREYTPHAYQEPPA